MIYAFLAPLQQNKLAPIFPENRPYEPHLLLGVAHSAYENDKEERVTFFSPRELTEKETEQLEGEIYNHLHDCEYRIQVRRYLGTIAYNPATIRILGRYYYILQVFGMMGLLSCLCQGVQRPDDIAQFFYWVLAMPLCIALAAGLVRWRAWETVKGLRLLLHSPIGIRVVVLPQLKKIEELLNKGEPYSKILEQIRDLGLPELIVFYRRASQYPRWVAGPPNVLGVIGQ